MKISLNWLKDYVAHGVSADKLAHRLTMAGLEVEKISSVAGDTVFELEITPNRPDCLNVLGIARETAAVFNKPLKVPKEKKFTLPKQKADIHIENKQDCSRYIGVLIEGVHVGAAAPWLKQRLEPIGIRSINSVVDITNFCLMEMGQPLHAFDYDKLNGGKIIVRRAKAGETIITIDGVERKLDPSILVIADAKKPVAIAGIMGGKETEVSERTKNILLESACFDPVLIRRAARKLGLSSDSSYRFERGVDIDGVRKTSHRAVDLIKQEAQGQLTKYADLFPGKAKVSRLSISVAMKRVHFVLGADLSLAQCANTLKKLGFTVTAQKDGLKATPPMFRNDIKIDADIIEELARIVGYDNLPSTYPVIKSSDVLSERNWNLKKQARNILLAQGLNEIITYTMSNRAAVTKSGINDSQGIKIQNPLTKEQEILRPSLLPSFLPVVAANFNRGQKDLKFFEIGRTYASLPEKEKIGILVTGQRESDWRVSEKNQADFSDLKGVIEELFQNSGVSVVFVPGSNGAMDPSACAEISVGGTSVGFLGKVKADVLNNWDIKQKNVYFAELDVEKSFTQAFPVRRYEPVSEFPPILRDVSIAVKKDITFEKIKETVFGAGTEVLRSINFVEQYMGDKIPSGQKGLVFSLVYQSPARTLREDEVNQVHEKICRALVDGLGAVRR